MLSLRPKLLVLLPVPLAVAVCQGQDNLAGAVQIRLALARLNVLGSVLMIGAHPDDEHTATLAYFARGRSMRTAYLAVTRGEGGQNLIGPEQGDLLGIIRDQELLAARRVDGAEQFFTRAIDFGYSKTPDETLAKWGRERILSDMVWVIRRFRPDVIILCFSGTSRDGHGHHQASAILGKEAFAAAADKTRFPDQLQWVQPWQARRLVWNVYGASDAPGQVRIDTGDYDPALGYSYMEIAAMSRSMHSSQGMGAMRHRGTSPTSFVPMAGEPASKDLFDGIDTTWDRVTGGAEVGRLLAEAAKKFDDEHPDRIVPLLLEARARLKDLGGAWAATKLGELDETIALASGLWLDASADRWAVTPGSKLSIRIAAIDRSPVPVTLDGVSIGDVVLKDRIPLEFNRPEVRDLSVTIAPDHPYSQPYWLAKPHGENYYDTPGHAEDPENPPVETASFVVRIGNENLTLLRPVVYRYADGSHGEMKRPVAVVPPVALEFSQPVVVFPNAQPKRVEVLVKSNVADASGQVRLEPPAEWRVEPAQRTFALAGVGDEATLAFELTPRDGPARGQIRAVATTGGRDVSSGMRVISYTHFSPQVVFPPSVAELVRADVKILAKRIGYVMGAGDQMPEALRQLGCEVTLLSADDLATGDLSRFDAILTGVRAYNVRPDLVANQHRLLDYVSNGGTLVVQYNVLSWRQSPDALSRIGPYPIRIGRDRVSVEEAPVVFTHPDDPLLAAPNRITAADFDGWVQERGLYFASDWDAHYKTLFESHDPGEQPHPGGTLYTRYGKGAYVFTAYSWFRQLPAGVPGAFRILANLLSAGKVPE
jgi:LmbE family N-acetylglucosaminyl deacetylase